MGKVSVIKRLLDFFNGGRDKDVNNMISEIKDLGDCWITSDEAKQAFHEKIEELAKLNKSTVDRSARSAILWVLSTI